ncbi:hypothetical protein SO802_004841 [Lithocarpus litseifolius]|uniref:Uncharacterized protein n=1 Tax=Lithocarpus litseifolius TaxID=425828 RepID=A0AAW2DJ38_9ROSI
MARFMFNAILYNAISYSLAPAPSPSSLPHRAMSNAFLYSLAPAPSPSSFHPQHRSAKDDIKWGIEVAIGIVSLITLIVGLYVAIRNNRRNPNSGGPVDRLL